MKDKQTEKKHKVWLTRLGYFLLGGMVVATCVLIAFYVWFMWMYSNRIVPGLRIESIPVAGMTEGQAIAQLTAATTEYIEKTFPLSFTFEDTPYRIDYSPQAISYDIEASVRNAFTYGRNGALKDRAYALYKAHREGVSLPLTMAVNRSWWHDQVASMAATIDVTPVKPSITVSGKTVSVKPGTDGRRVEEINFINAIEQQLTTLSPITLTIPIAEITNPISDMALETTKARAENILVKSLTLTLPEDFYQATKIVLPGKDWISWLSFDGGYEEEKIKNYLETLSQTYNREAQDAKFFFNNETNRVGEFTPPQDGLKLNIPESQKNIQQLTQLIETQNATEAADLIFDRTKPTTSLADVNTMGITTLIGRGFSTFKGSIASRVHNVTLAASRINGTLVKPGEVFSFNQAVGEVTGATGYQKAYIIRNGRTELDDGGGVCQVSTTVFRAALDAGLPITERRAHAYRVGYYEQNAKAGLDATVFSPTTDLKFINDTPAHFLIQTTVDVPNRALTVDIYGTSDGRTSEISNHTLWDITAAPPDVYQDDPTLPSGTIKQVEHAVKGAKAKFDYTVSRGGEVVYSKTFYSIFKPWANVYLRGTKI